MAFCPEHPKWDQNPKFTPLRDDEHPHPFHMEVLPGGYFQFTWRKKTNRQLEAFRWQIPSSPPSERRRCYAAPSFELASLYLAYGPHQKLISVCVLFKHPGTNNPRLLSRICCSILIALFLAKRERTLLCMLWNFIDFPHWDFSHVMLSYFFSF